VSAFSLIGLPDTWQVPALGYNLPLFIPPSGIDIGGPMNLSEEYRWNSPVVTYAYDESCLNYFGAAGVAAVEKAIRILNDLPSASAMSPDLSEFSLDTRRFNYEATALSLFDLTSVTLSCFLEHMGLTAAERYVWTLRARVVVNNIPIYHTIKRSFDPVTLEPSSYVNGTLYTYSIRQTLANPDVWEAIDLVVDPNAPAVTSVAAYMGIASGAVDNRGAITIIAPGIFYTGLTRDDAGALRYIYHRNNANVENLQPGTIGSSSGCPWCIPGGTNAVAVNTALRPGVEKITFVRLEFDSIIGQSPTFTNRYTDVYITNGMTFRQTVERVSNLPDILISAADLGVAVNTGTPVPYTRNASYVNNDTINGGSGVIKAGPGNIQPTIEMSFSNVGPWIENFGDGSEEFGLIGLIWGSFDGTTNAPVVFPIGTSIQEIESRVLSLRRGGSQWVIP
jgi:hypothetical protein